MTRIFFLCIFSAIVSWSCNNNDTTSPYDEILSQPPFASITDSIHHDPSNAELYYRRAVLLVKNNNKPPALADLQKAWSLKKQEKYAVGISNVLADKPDSSIAFTREALKSFPQSLPLQYNLALSYSEIKKSDEALALCNRIITQEPGQLQTLQLKADLLDEKGDSVGAMQTLEQAYSYAPSNEDVCYSLAFKYAENRNPKVLSLCDSLQKAMPEKGEPYYFRGIYYSNLNDKAKAITLFDQTIQHDYNYLNAYIEKGKILFDQKKLNGAFTVFSLAAKISPTYPDAYYWMGRCQEEFGQKAEAKANYERAYGLDKTFTEAKDAAQRVSR